MHPGALVAVLLAAAGIGVFAQAQQSTPAFAVASIKRSVPIEIARTQVVRAGAIQAGTRWLATNVPLLTILRGAYGPYSMPGQVVGYPSWVGEDQYDIDARADTEVTREQMQLMVRQLLHARFKLETHVEKRELPGYTLTRARAEGPLGKGLLPATAGCWQTASADTSPPVQRAGWLRPCDRRISRRDGAMGLWASNSPIASLAAMLQSLVEQPVLDRTGIDGNFDIEMVFAPEGMLGVASTAETNAPSLFTALREQLGLKLEREHATVDVLVVDRVERPTEN